MMAWIYSKAFEFGLCLFFLYENMSEESKSPNPIAGQSNSKRPDDPGNIRKRVSQACDPCRGRKLKCDGVRPVCSTCQTHRKECSYGFVTKKRGLPEGYVRGLERLLGLTLASIGGIQEVVDGFEAATKDESARKHLSNQWNGNTSGDTLPDVWRSSRLCKNFESLLPVLDSGNTDSKRQRTEQQMEGRSNASQPQGAPRDIETYTAAADLYNLAQSRSQPSQSSKTSEYDQFLPPALSEDPTFGRDMGASPEPDGFDFFSNLDHQYVFGPDFEGS
jgi:hypothetical protein